MTTIQVILLLCYTSAAFCLPSSLDFESAAIGSEYCAGGQVAWCKDFFAATECNAVNHCIQSVWLTHDPPTNAGVCDTCISTIEKFRKLDSNESKEIFEELLENVCSLTRLTDIFRKRCEKYVDRYVDPYFNQLLDLLHSKVDPLTVCHVLRLCAKLEPTTTIISRNDDDDVVVRFESIVLHFPAHLIDLPRSKELLGSAQCTWGPSYWCNNLTSANECEATSHCVQYVWPTLRFDEDDDSVCNICKDMVKIVRDEINSNKTQQDLKLVVEHSCRLIPIEEVRNDCITLADKYVHQLTELVLSKLDPTATCSVVGLCNSARIDRLLAAMPTSQPDEAAAACVSCTAAFTAVERFMEIAPQRAILDKLLRLCGQLSTYSSSCSSLIASNFARFYGWLRREMRPFPVCHLSGVCAYHYHLHPSAADDVDMVAEVETMLATADDTVYCDLCKKFVANVKQVLTVNTTEQEFQAMLEGICKQTGDFKADCLKIVDDGVGTFYHFLTIELNPAEVCADMDLCPKKDAITDEGLNLITGPESAVAEISTALATENSVGSADCDVCKVVIKVAQKELRKPEYQHDIRKLLGKICRMVPRPSRGKCSHFIDKYSGVLVNILVHHTDPGTVCSMLHECVTATPLTKFEFCPLCRDIMSFVEYHLQDKEVDQIKGVLKQVCGYMPKSEVPKCKTLVEDYTELIVGLLHDELDPSLVCPALKLCSSNVTLAEQCSRCQLLIADLTEKLGSDRSEGNVAGKLIVLAPADAAERNELTASQLRVVHRDDIVDMMAAEFDAQESCVFLRFCEPSMVGANEIDGDVSEELVSAPDSGTAAKPYCELCEMLVQRYENELLSNTSAKELERKLQKFCLKLRNPVLRSNCTDFVVEYFPQIFNILKKDVRPQSVCSLAHICSPAASGHLARSEREAERCEFCEAVVNSYSGLVSNPLMVHRSISKLIQICSLFDDEEISRCMEIVSNVAPLMETGSSSIPSWFYCVDTGMCPHGAHLTYKEVCTDQTQWCADVKKALLCDKVEYCQQQVWKSEKPSL